METAALTRGSIPPQLVSLALPLIFGNILQQLYNTIDAMVIGRFAGETAFAAIGVAGTVMNLFLFLLSGCCTGISVLFAQQYGSRDLAGFRQEGFLASVFGGLFTLVLSLAALLLLRPLLTLMQTPEDVARLAADYLVVIFGGLLATFFYNLCAAALRSVGDTRSALLALLAAMAANLALDLLFVARLGMGIAGAAWATVLAQLLSVALCLLYLARRYPQLLFRREDRRLDRGLLRRTVSYGAVSALHQSSLYIGKLLVQGAVNSMGTPMISAYTATTRIEGFANSFGDSGAQAVSVFTAQNTGAGEERRVREGFRTSFLMMLALGAVMSVLLYAAAPAAIALLAGETSSFTQTNGVAYLRMVGCFYILCFLGNTFVGYFRGRGQVTVPVYGTIIQISARVILSYALIRPMGLSGVALALAFLLGLFIFLVYKKSYSGVMYSPSFGVTLIALALITTLLILAVTSNIVLSLGMVGALSIVRFRTAIKEPMDIAFLFWAIAAGIVLAAGLIPLAVVGSLFVGVVLLVFSRQKNGENPYILVVHCASEQEEAQVRSLVESRVRRLNLKSKSVSPGQIELNYEVRLRQADTGFVNELGAMEGISQVVLVSYNGDYMG